MIALSVSNINLSFGADVILKDVSFAVNDQDKLGIIGVNGAGKTSLFRVITGEYDCGGGIYIQKGHTIGVLEQNPRLSSLPSDMTALEYMFSAFPRLLELEAEIRRTESLVADASEKGDDGRTVLLADTLSRLNSEYASGGGLEFRSRCRSMLLRLGFDDEIINRKISTLSGGQYTKLSLARLLASEPDILMLDEPTNHLDIDALNWLEGFISSYKKTVLIISHDRYFLDRTTNKTLELLYGRATMYNGSYSTCKEQQELNRASLEKRYKEQQKEIAKIKENIEFQRRCNREHNFVTIRSKEKQLERMERVELMPNAPKDIRLSFLEEADSCGDVLIAKDLSFSYEERPVFSGLSFIIRRYERVLFLGENGCGKSTLMKLITSRLQKTSGSLELGYNIKIGYFDQENRTLCDDKTVFGQMRDEYPDRTDKDLRSALALFLFDSDDISRKISTLSGGERARLTLARLILKKVNLLVMDEPTNHLDIGSCEALENALDAFGGTVIAVSHDRYFINKIATRIIELDRTCDRGLVDYQLEEYDDAYTEYMRMREERKTKAPEQQKNTQTACSKEDYEQRKRENSLRRAQERKVEKAKEKIEKLEGRLDELEKELFGEAASNYVRAAEIDNEKNRIEAELLELYELVM